MSIWKRIMHRFETHEIQDWSSLQKTGYLLLPLLIYLLVHDVAEIALWAVLELLISVFGEEVNAVLTKQVYTLQGAVNGLSIIIGLAAVYKGVKAELEGSIQKKDKGVQEWGRMQKVTAYIFLAAIAFLTAVGVNILFYQLGITESSVRFNQVQKVQFGVQFWAGFILYGVISPIAEEAVFRGIIYNRMKRCFSYGVALAVSSLLFGCYHGNAVQAVYGTLLGLLIAYGYELFGDFAAPVLFHSVANISVFSMTYLEGFRRTEPWFAITIAVLMLSAAAGIWWYLKRTLNEAK